MQDILVQLGNYEFPMVVAAYLLVRVEKKLDTLTAAIYGLGQVLGQLTGTGRQVPYLLPPAPRPELDPLKGGEPG